MGSQPVWRRGPVSAGPRSARSGRFWAIVYEPQALVYEPRSIIYEPRAIVYEPRAISYEPRNVVYEPQALVYEPRSIKYEPRAIAYKPQRMGSQPVWRRGPSSAGPRSARSAGCCSPSSEPAISIVSVPELRFVK